MGPVGDRVFVVQHSAGNLCSSPRSACKPMYPHSPVQTSRHSLNRTVTGTRCAPCPRSPCQGRRALCDRTSNACRRSQSTCPDSNPTLPIRRRNGPNTSLRATMKENEQTEKTIKEIEMAVKAVHTALACNRAKLAQRRCRSPSPVSTCAPSLSSGTFSGEASPATARAGVDYAAHTTRSLAAARLAKQKQFGPEARSPRSPGPGDDPLANSRRSLADARDQHKINKQAVERSVSYCGGLLAKLDDMQKIAIACQGAKCAY